MNIEYTENTKYVEDIVRKYITDPEDCDTVIWCLQKMHIDIDSLVAILKRKDKYIEDKHAELTRRSRKIWELMQQANKAAETPKTKIILKYKDYESRFAIPYTVLFSDRMFGIFASEYNRSYDCKSEVTVLWQPDGTIYMIFLTESDYKQVKLICEEVTELSKRQEVGNNESDIQS